MLKNKRVFRHTRVRSKVEGTLERPRLAVFRSGQHIYAQIIDDKNGKTLIAKSDIKVDKGTKTERAKTVGEDLAKAAIAKKIKKVVFDRGGFKYHGRVAALAESARKGGLDF